MHIVQYLTVHVLVLQRSGGGTLVENSTFGLSRNMDFVVKVAKETDVHIVAGTGVYTRYYTYYCSSMQLNMGWSVFIVPRTGPSYT